MDFRDCGGRGEVWTRKFKGEGLGSGFLGAREKVWACTLRYGGRSIRWPELRDPQQVERKEGGLTETHISLFYMFMYDRMV